MDVGRKIGAALTRIAAEDAEDAARLKYQAALKVLRAIPSGTADIDLTDEQRQAWTDHDAALAVFNATR